MQETTPGALFLRNLYEQISYYWLGWGVGLRKDSGVSFFYLISFFETRFLCVALAVPELAL